MFGALEAEGAREEPNSKSGQETHPTGNIDEKFKNLSDCFLGTELRAPRRVIANPEGAPLLKPRLLALSAADRACLTHGA